jgi:hypothetical protein
VGITYAGEKSVDQYFAIDAITAKPVVEQLKTGVDIDSIGINVSGVRGFYISDISVAASYNHKVVY